MGKSGYDIIIVGGGIAGLTSAAYLARKGRKILLIEKNKKVGGLVSSFECDGFLFEGGVRALESAGIILPMLEDLGIQLDVVRSKVSVGVGDHIINIEDTESIYDYRNLLVGLFPSSDEEIDNYIKTMLKIMKHLDVLYGIDNPIFKDLIKDRKYLFKKLLPWLPRFILTIGKINRLNMPVEDYLKRLITNPSLRDIISQHFFKGTPAFFALSYFSLYLDYFYPKGGVGKLADVLEEKILEFDGKIILNTKIDEVLLKQGYVVDDNNIKYQYDNLIWAADLKTFYNISNSENIDSKIKTRFDSSKERILAKNGGESVFTLYLEVDLPLSYFQGIANGHFFYTPLKAGLSDTHRNELKSMLNNWEKIDKKDILSWLERLLELNTFEISIPGLKDPSLVPGNKTGLIISYITDYGLFEKIRGSGWYEEIRKAIEDKIIMVLSDSVFPLMRNKIIKQFSFTPISVKNMAGSSEGAIVGWSFEEKVPVLNKIQSSDKAVITPLPNVFQAGQWAYSPAGVPMSILTGKLAADRICRQYRS